MPADAAEAPRHLEADDLIEGGPQAGACPGCSNRRRQDDLARPAIAQDPRGSPSGRSRRDSIVDDDDRPVAQIRRSGRGPKLGNDPFDLMRRLANQGIQLVKPHATGGDHIIIENDRTILADGTQRKLRLPRHPDLANHEHIQWRFQGLRHQRRDRDATPGETQNQSAGGPERARRIAKPVGDQDSQLEPGIGAVPKHPSSLPPRALSRWRWL